MSGNDVLRELQTASGPDQRLVQTIAATTSNLTLTLGGAETSTSYRIQAREIFISSTGAISVTMPAVAVMTGIGITFVNTGSYTITILDSAAATIVTLAAGQSSRISCNGVVWGVMSDPNFDTAAVSAGSVTGTATPFPIAGLAAAQGGIVAVAGGASSTSANAGGAATVTGGAAGATGVGGAVTLAGAAGGATSGAGGVASLTGGAGTAGNSAGGIGKVVGGAGQGSAAGGKAQATGGAGGATGAGGAVEATGGAGGATSGTGGAAALAGGAGTAGTATGGAASATGGAGSAGATTVAGGVGGAASLVGGAGGAKTDTGAAAGGAGGAIAVTSGVGGATASSGSDAGGAAGTVAIAGANGGAASAGTGNGGKGGTITLTPGTGGTSAGGTAGKDGVIIERGVKLVKQGAPAAKTTSSTLTAAEVLTGIITVNQAAAGSSAQQLPLASDMDTALPDAAAGDAFDFSVINTSTVDAEDASVTTNTGWTLVGSMDVHAYSAAGSLDASARFRARKTGSATWTLYRIA